MRTQTRRMRRIVIAALIGVLATIGLIAQPSAAHAATGWTTLKRWPNGSVFLACQYTETGGYGPVWHTRLVLAHHPSEGVRHLRATFVVKRMTPWGSYQETARTELATDGIGQWDVRDAFGSQIGAQYQGRWYADRWSYSAGDETGGQGDSNPTAFTQLRRCG